MFQSNHCIQPPHSEDLPWQLPLEFLQDAVWIQFHLQLCHQVLFNFPHHPGLNTAYVPTKQIPEATHSSWALGSWTIHTGSNCKPAENSFALHWTDHWQHPQSTAGLFWRSQAQDRAHTMKAAISLSLLVESSASGTEHEDFPEFSKGSLIRSETHSFTIHHFLSIWGHKVLFPLLLTLSQLMQWHHATLARHTCLKTGTLKLLKYTLKLKNVKSLHFQQSPLILQLPCSPSSEA